MSCPYRYQYEGNQVLCLNMRLTVICKTFFATPYSLKKEIILLLLWKKDKQYRKSELCLMFQRKHPEHVQLSVSEDSTIFKKVAADNKNGELSASFSTLAMIKALKMELTTPLMARLTIKRRLSFATMNKQV